MNKVNFLNKDNFPLYSEGLAKLQSAIFMTANLALLGGSNYILSGCIDDGKGNVSDGMVVINGEPLELVGAAKKEKIAIREVRTPLTAFGVEYPESYTTRYVEFSDNGEYEWVKFEPIPTNMQLYNQIKNIAGEPVGTIKFTAVFIGKIDKDYMLCDGRELSVNEYPELFDAIGTQFGGDGVNSFALPNIGGRTIMGYTGNGDYIMGKTGGAEFVELETKHLPNHNHTDHKDSLFNKLSARAADIDATNTPESIDGNTADQEYRVGGMSTPQWSEATIKSVGENVPHENRSPYISLPAIIKVR